MYLLLDRVDEALPYLRSGAESCPVKAGSPWIPSWLHHGRGLEKKGVKEGACRAYGRVLDRWGHAKPKSVTADEARARAKALRCEPR